MIVNVIDVICLLGVTVLGIAVILALAGSTDGNLM